MKAKANTNPTNGALTMLPLNTQTNLDWKECTSCGDDVHVERWNLGYRVCKSCGDQQAQEARASWCIIQEYGKGNYQYVTTETAFVSLRNTNQKQPRG